MGGGDLNLKKSWHPSTMKNMEKVWKAEQQDHEEKKKIAQLKRELELERSKEEMISYARDQGVIEQKGDKKLDWMYTGPNNSVNKEDYLLGKPIDKAFEESEQMKKDLELNRAPKNHVEHECIPPSLRNFSGTEQIDLARKLQEDPLFAIKKKEMESKAQLLKNPVRLKHLKQLLEKQSKEKSDKKSKKKDKKRKSKHESDSDEELNALLASKYKKLKGKVSAQDLLKNLEKKKKYKKRDKVSSSESSSDSDDSSNDSRSRKKRKNRSPSRESKSEKNGSKKSRTERDYHESREREKSDDYHRKNKESYRQSRGRERSRSPKFERKNYGLVKADGSRLVVISKKSLSPERKISRSRKKEEKRWVPPKREKISEEEKEKRMKEMMENASWRDKERTKDAKRSREEKRKELSQQEFSKDFMRTHLAKAVGSISLESRIKSKVQSLQRSSNAMDSNFARR